MRSRTLKSPKVNWTIISEVKGSTAKRGTSLRGFGDPVGVILHISLNNRAQCQLISMGQLECWPDLIARVIPSRNPYVVKWLKWRTVHSVYLSHANQFALYVSCYRCRHSCQLTRSRLRMKIRRVRRHTALRCAASTDFTIRSVTPNREERTEFLLERANRRKNGVSFLNVQVYWIRLWILLPCCNRIETWASSSREGTLVGPNIEGMFNTISMSVFSLIDSTTHYARRPVGRLVFSQERVNKNPT